MVKRLFQIGFRYWTAPEYINLHQKESRGREESKNTSTKPFIPEPEGVSPSEIHNTGNTFHAFKAATEVFDSEFLVRYSFSNFPAISKEGETEKICTT
uniref:Uncharacterized protein n=1 Tax=Nelumbo nucifera TaxID=4432 RepID=A0A822XG43_NELNU|nr:TPA_asm: hypothetical protein HUJ06_020650 [Nelumbo nucifera]